MTSGRRSYPGPAWQHATKTEAWALLPHQSPTTSAHTTSRYQPPQPNIT